MLIVIEPLFGLANRMRAIDSAAQLARATGAALFVLWQRDEGLGASLRSLLSVSVRRFDADSRTRLGRLQLTAIRKVIYRVADEVYGVEDALNLQPQSIAGKRLVYVRTCHRFGSREQPSVAFRPSPQLETIVRSHTKLFGQVVGVHIRRGDNRQAMDASPTSAFIERMRAEVHSNPTIQFFLCTDSPDEERAIRDEFGKRILTHPKRSLSRGSDTGMEDAVVDFFCLAACPRILASYWSSFSEEAARVGGAQLEVIVQGRANT